MPQMTKDELTKHQSVHLALELIHDQSIYFRDFWLLLLIPHRPNFRKILLQAIFNHLYYLKQPFRLDSI